MKQIRITNKNHSRLGLVSTDCSMTAKLNEILNLYFESLGGEKEHKKIAKKMKKYLARPQK